MHAKIPPSARHRSPNPSRLLSVRGLLLWTSLGAALWAWTASVRGATEDAAKPRLVLWLVVDQLSAPLLRGNLDRFPPGGFRRLLERGLFYTEARYRHGVTFTACGHATLFTGKHPSQHGMVANEWADRSTGVEIACVEDPDHQLLGEPTPPHQGTSPRHLLAPTVGDALVDATAGLGQVYSVSFKDRGSILPGGHRGKAFWYSGRTGRFVTSDYYYAEPPPWLAAWNRNQPVERYRGRQWELLRPRSDYRQAGNDDRPYERDHRHLGRTFPHALTGGKPEDLYGLISCTPFGDELTLDLVRTLIHETALGKDPTPDILAISFSSTDQIGHLFGPDSLEAEDNLFRIDRVLAELFGVVDAEIGEARTLTILTSDHGMDVVPESLHALTCGEKRAEQGWVPRSPNSAFLKRQLPDGTWWPCCAAGRHDVAEHLSLANAELGRRFRTDRPLTKSFWSPWIYLDEGAIRAQGLDLAEVERALVDVLSPLPGMAALLTRTDLEQGRLPYSPVFVKIQRSYHPDRCGHVMIVPAPHWYLYTKTTEYAATHGSPFDYDAHVPLLISGHGIPPRQVTRPVFMDTLAHAVAARLGLPGFACPAEEQLHELVSDPGSALR